MKQSKSILLFFLGLLFLTALACGGEFSTANISDATLALDEAGATPTTVFNSGDTFYLVVDLANAPDSTTVKAAWTAVSVADADPNTFLDEVELTSGSGNLTFTLENDSLWPAGDYKVDIYLNDTLDRTLTFQVVN